jgi:hypothetical protein
MRPRFAGGRSSRRRARASPAAPSRVEIGSPRGRARRRRRRGISGVDRPWPGRRLRRARLRARLGLGRRRWPHLRLLGRPVRVRGVACAAREGEEHGRRCRDEGDQNRGLLQHGDAPCGREARTSVIVPLVPPRHPGVRSLARRAARCDEQPTCRPTRSGRAPRSIVLARGGGAGHVVHPDAGRRPGRPPPERSHGDLHPARTLRPHRADLDERNRGLLNAARVLLTDTFSCASRRKICMCSVRQRGDARVFADTTMRAAGGGRLHPARRARHARCRSTVRRWLAWCGRRLPGESP